MKLAREKRHPPCSSSIKMVRLSGIILLRIAQKEFQARPSWSICPSKVVTETGFESLAKWEQATGENFTLPEFDNWFEPVTALVEFG